MTSARPVAAPGVVAFSLKAGCCLTAYDPRSGRGGLVNLDESQLSGRGLQTALAALGEQSGGALAAAELKLVGPDALIAVVQKSLAAAGLQVKAAVAVDEFPAEMFFYPETGRLRLARTGSSAVASPSVTLSPVRKKHRLLIVDDSPTIQRLLSQIFSREADFEVVGVTGVPGEVEGLVARLRPDVMTLDIHMPGMDGVQVLKQLLPHTPLPTVMITSLSLDEGGKVLDALAAGAVDYVQKPSLATLSQQAGAIVASVRGATQAKVRLAPAVQSSAVARMELKPNLLVVIGSSTGGTEALKDLLTKLPAEIPPILIVQHIPPVFSAALAQRLDSLCLFAVKEAEHHDDVIYNRVLIAPGGKHMRLNNNGSKVKLDDAAVFNHHRPSVDLLFASATALRPKATIAILLTGMGTDGAQGMLALRQAGASTIAQDEKSSVVYGMPREAAKLGAAGQILSLSAIPAALMKLAAK